MHVGQFGPVIPTETTQSRIQESLVCQVDIPRHLFEEGLILK